LSYQLFRTIPNGYTSAGLSDAAKNVPADTADRRARIILRSTKLIWKFETITLAALWGSSVGTPPATANQTADVSQQNRSHLPADEWACSDQGVTCRAYTPLRFESTRVAYHAGYIEESRRRPTEVRRTPDILDGHRITLRNPVEDIHDTDHYHLYRLCYDRDANDGTDECRQVIRPQPEIGQIHPEVKDPRRMPYNLEIAEMKKEEGGSDKAQYFVVKLWMQENREATTEEVRLFEEKRTREPKYPQLASSGCTAEPCDPRLIRGLPTSHFNLRYRFIENAEKISFEATQETRDAIKSISDKTTLWKE